MTGASDSPAPAAVIDELFERAMRLHQEDQLDDAEVTYREILKIDPRQADALHLLGAVAYRRGHASDAVDLIGKAIALSDGIAAYHVDLAEAHHALGQIDPAITHYRRAIALQPDHWAAHNKLADALRDHGDLAAATTHYASAVKLKPNLASAQHNLAAVLLDQGRSNEALDAASRALAARDEADTRTLFVICARNADRLPGAPEFRQQIIRALRDVWARPGELTGPAIALITNEPIVAAGIRSAMAAWPRRLSPNECRPVIGALANDELLRAVMNNAVVNHPGLERLLTSVRTILLDAAAQAQSDVSREMIDFSSSLARQCFNNEYVFDVSDTERQALAWLRTSVRTALASRSPVFAIHLIALACYAPLHTLDRDDTLLGRKWLKPVEALITEQIREPRAERALRDAMPRITEIANAVSKEVRQQYEENPYPRWISVAPTLPENGIIAHLHGLFPNAHLSEFIEPDKLGILVAGCGTGQQPIGTAQRFPKAHVLAIDLSLASLAYAKRKSDEAGIKIEYAQADILELALDRRFDIVESSGVLHHLAQPMRGWAVLTKLVKPGGFMRIGLYSELGRSNIVALHQIIAEHGYGATPDEIRRARQDLFSRQEGRFLSTLYSPDFYSVSACRDLLFHVQEHRLTLPQIGTFLAENGLKLLGFEFDGPTLARYRVAFPEDTTMTDLAAWHRFETVNPDTFRSMYNFWVQKAS